MLRRVGLLALALPALLAGTRPGQAEWADFYRPAPRTEAALAEPLQTPRPASGDASGACIREILHAQLRYRIPGNLLLAIGLQEAGIMHKGELTVWPYAANAEGDGRYFPDADAASDWVRAQLDVGVESVDVGCMQINLRWHPEAFVTPEQGFDPARNVDYAARFLTRLHSRTGDWTTAATRYHSGTEQYQTAYLDRLKGNLQIANDRLDTFRELAAASGGGNTTGRMPHLSTQDARPQPPALPASHFWTSEITRRSGAAEEGARSLYGREVIAPLLPAFRKMF
ncbi:lytic transglycosylase domain-containing protein [Sagittula sp. M10.9X]|uniref:Lytic transglycosylase domain-containing protein n=1 Tax=Sagittula salina TaxID=2820268 RepID=A0A940MRF6_9RHOB|nr:lytic transglycosylase domain-containing protein [Sagittula salina]